MYQKKEMNTLNEISYLIGLIGSLFILVSSFDEKDLIKKIIMSGVTCGIFIGFITYQFHLNIPPYIRISPYIVAIVTASVLTYKHKFKKNVLHK